MKKIALITVMLIITTITLTSCGDSGRFEKLEDFTVDGIYGSILYDKKTSVLYLSYREGLSVMYDSNGEILTYYRYIESNVEIKKMVVNVDDINDPVKAKKLVERFLAD